MFELAFKAELTAIKANEILIDKLWNEINAHYINRNRHYHTLTHLDNLIAELSLIKSKLTDWRVIIFSIAYHDIVYNILKKDNEEKSAGFAVERMTLLNFPEEAKQKCKTQILATKTHGDSADSDINYFIDADLAILGSDEHAYKIYTQQIRREYKFYPDLLYNPGRKKILEHFLQMKSIYKTSYFAQKYEQQARENIEAEIKELG